MEEKESEEKKEKEKKALQQIYVLVVHKIMSLKVKFTSSFAFCDGKIDVTTFVTLAPSLKAKSDDIILLSRITDNKVTIIHNVTL